MPKNTSKNNKKTKKKETMNFRFRPIDWFCVIVGMVASILTVIFNHDYSPVYIIASLVALNCGVIEVIFGINGRRINYVFAMMNAIASIIIAWGDQFYGNMVINIYYIPVCIAGFYLWGKHSHKNKDVIARKLSAKQWVVATLIFIVSFILLNFILTYFDGHSTILDSVTTILIIFASILGVLRYREQWIVWVFTDSILLIMWIPTGNPAVLALRTFYVFSSIYGYINWRKLLQKPTT